MKLAIFAILVAFVATEVASQACHMREVDLCMAISMFHYQSNGVPSDEEKMEDWCETLKEVSECMGNYSAKCLSPLQREVISLFAGADSVTDQLCTPGSEMRAKYLRHAECLSEGAESDIFKSHIRDLQVAIETAFDVEFNDRLTTLCCGFRRFDQNTGQSTGEMCGQDAVEMTRGVMKALTTDLPEVLCKRYDPQSEECLNTLPPVGSTPKGSEGKSQIGKLLDTVFGNM